ncbi:hypothetical protein HF313_05660 [Massilia atriviolacea]|uniref:Tle cognate immunity protein 4 C-terminal domain-containing protein n=1 Tax=Massilia atriviolacea TaxID=2495579 RepID=A0A430HH59_9BURK|nr:T6SS immunity protein Tli4 family protein [Massilia atriviolacea]RSZ56874.1 hypothetical protein EJB06_21275 [Massilia atriviolacea]
MSAQTPRLQALFENTRTVCFGRFLMQVPAAATVVYGPAEADTPIRRLPGEGARVTDHLARRLADIENERDFLLKDDIPKLPLFGKVLDGAVPGQKIVFGSKNQVGYTIDSYVPVGDDLFVQHLNSVLPQHDRIATINRIASHLRLRAGDEVPAEPGSCIDGGFIPLDQKFERVTVGIRLKEFPDVHFSVEVHKNQERLAESGSLELLREQAKNDAAQRGLGALYARIQILRRQTRQLGAWSGPDIASRTPAHGNETEAHEFRFQSLGAVNDPLQPLLDVRLDSGVKDDRKASVKPSITDEEAIALWDGLIGSIRIRPGGVAKPATAAARARVPLASLAATGNPCPETGWWQCSESGRVDGGTRRHFIAGEPLPPAVFLGEPRLWHKLGASLPTHTAATIWQLVAYGAPDNTTAHQAIRGSDEGEPHA